MVRKLGGEDDAFISYRTSQYRMHYYETPTNLRFVLLTDTGTMSMRNVLHQIYINLWVEYGTSVLLGAWVTTRRVSKKKKKGGGFTTKADVCKQWSRIPSRQSSTRAARASGTSSSRSAWTSSSGVCYDELTLLRLHTHIEQSPPARPSTPTLQNYERSFSPSPGEAVSPKHPHARTKR